MQDAQDAHHLKAKLFLAFVRHKDEHYYGFKGHVLIDLNQHVVGFTLAPANIDERDVLDDLRGKISGLLIADKGLLSKIRQEGLAKEGLHLQTPLRNTMKDERPEELVKLMMTIRRRVETAIGQLTEVFGFSTCKARDLWHLNAKRLRKLIACNFTKN